MNFSTKFVYTSHVCRHCSSCLHHFTHVRLSRGLEGKRTAKVLEFIFTHSSQVIRMKSDGTLKEFTLNLMTSLYNVDFVDLGNSLLC